MSEFKEPLKVGSSLASAAVDWLLILLAGSILTFASWLVFRVTVVGKGNIPKEGRVLFLLRHRSVVDPFLMEPELVFPWVLGNIAMFPVNVGRQSHLKGVGRVLRWLVWHLHVIELPPREAGKRSQVVRAQIQALQNGPDCSQILFATGTRDKPDEKGLPPFMPGVGRVVAEALPKVVFVWIEGTSGFWPKGQTFPSLRLGRRFPVTISISEPLDAADQTSELYQLCTSLPPQEVGKPVADFLHDLCWAWVTGQ